MYEQGYLQKSDYEDACREKIKISKQVQEFKNYETTYIVYCAVQYLMELHGFDFRYQFESEEDYKQYQESYESAYNLEKSNLYANGYTITTSLNADAQRGADALEQIPCALVGHPQLPGQLDCGDPSLILAHQIECKKPLRQRQMGLVQDRPCRHGNLVTALGALISAIAQPVSMPTPTFGADVPLFPPLCCQIVQARTSC